jgi:CHASE2 domain-containing sensor protein
VNALILKSNSFLSRLKDKGISYWLVASIIVGVSAAGSPYVYDYFNIQAARSWIFQKLLEWGPRAIEPKYTKIVLIEDDDYWLGDLAGRRPIKRDYLANLVEKLSLAHAHVIALDFDIRSLDPTSSQIPEEYRQETHDLIKEIVQAAARGTKIVLAAPIFWDDERGEYYED